MDEASQQANPERHSEPVAGERLAAARRERAISVIDIAKELHLDEPKVRALEENRFDDFGAPVFAKGHMRKYAELVGVSTEDVLEDYYKLNRSTGAPPVVGRTRKPPRDINAGPWVAAVILAVVFGAAAWWWLTRETSDPVAQSAPATTPAPAVVTPVVTPEPGAVAREEMPAVEPDPQPDAADDAVAAAGATTEAPPDPVAESAIDAVDLGPQVTVELVFTGDCWTEITDVYGRRLFYDLGTAGRVISLRGAAPLRVVLGDADNVSVAVDGTDVAITPTDRSGRLARLTIDSQG